MIKRRNYKGKDSMVERYRRTLLIIVLSLSCVAHSFGQNKRVSGTVTDDEAGEALPGATVMLEGTSIGTVTDVNGRYALDIVGDDPRLAVSFVGFETKIIEVGNRSVVDAALRFSVNALEEVTVVGYGTSTKRDLTGAVSSVKGSAFESAAPLSFQNALAGRVAGVQITQTDNAPGAGMNVLIRGGSTLTSGNQPLYVIDGFPIVPDNSDPTSNPLADLSPNQIKSVEVLKDASATAVYGAQGANGVIIITTKSGQLGKPQIDVDVSYGLSEIAAYPDILSPSEFAELQIENIETYDFRNLQGQSESLEFWQNMADSSEYYGKNWIEEITRLAHTQNVNLSFSGGVEGLKYALSANYFNQDGIVINTGFERLNLNFNLDQQIGEKVKLGTSIKLATSQNTGLINAQNEASIIKKALQTNPFIADDFSFLDDIDEGSETYSWNNDNIITYINTVDNELESNRMIGNLFLEYEVLKGLRFYTSYGFNLNKRDQYNFLPIDTQQGNLIGGRVDFRNRNDKRFVYQARFNYNKRLGKHSLKATGVFETSQNESTDFRSRLEGFSDDSRGVYDLSSASTVYVPTNEFQDNSLLSYLGRLNYGYGGKYLLTASIRADASSKFGPNNKWGYFPSLAIGWVISDEAFAQAIPALDFLKLRASYGVTGNNQIPNYQSLATLSTERYIFDDGLQSGLVPATLANPDLKWETTDQYNIGADIGLFESRVQLTAEVYYKLTTDLLLEVQLPTSSGFSTALQNVGSISNRGLEIALTTLNQSRGDFSWTSSLTFSMNRTKVLDLGETNEMFFSRNFNNRIENDVLVRVGEEIGIFYGYIEDEILNTDTEIANSPEMQILENTIGQIKLLDVNGDGVVNTADRVPLAKTVPDFIGGLNNQITYKNFDLSFFFRWSYGNDVINGNLIFLEDAGTQNWNTLSSYTEYRYSPRNPEGTVHGEVQNTYRNLMRSSYVEDGSFLKLDYVTLGMTYPQEALDKLGLGSLRIYGRVTNPWMSTRYSWFDPEVNTGWGTAAQVGPGADIGSYPRAITYTIGLNVGF